VETHKLSSGAKRTQRHNEKEKLRESANSERALMSRSEKAVEKRRDALVRYGNDVKQWQENTPHEKEENAM
jgi:hypothetical protein